MNDRQVYSFKTIRHRLRVPRTVRLSRQDEGNTNPPNILPPPPVPSFAQPSLKEKDRPMNRLFSPRTLLFLLLLAIFVPRAGAQAVLSLNDIKSQAELDKAIAALDGALFDSYNRCDLEKFSSFLRRRRRVLSRSGRCHSWQSGAH